MLIRHKRHFLQGFVLIAAFFGLCIYLLCPMLHDSYGNRLTGLQYADNVFNSLAKGSSYFIPEVRTEITRVGGREMAVNVSIPPELGYAAVRVLERVGAEARYDNGRLDYKGDMVNILLAAMNVGDSLYHNDHTTVEHTFRMPALLCSKAWWYALHPAIKDLQRQGKIEEAKVVDTVLRKALEPGNNFYSVEIAQVKEHVLLVVFMLSFYILYTIWYGFGIFQLFEGFGLSMSKGH